VPSWQAGPCDLMKLIGVVWIAQPQVPDRYRFCKHLQHKAAAGSCVPSVHTCTCMVLHSRQGACSGEREGLSGAVASADAGASPVA
jgi:hypothetical protein